MTKYTLNILLITAVGLICTEVLSQSNKLPETILIDARLLKENKDKIDKGDKKLNSAKLALIKDADKACSHGPYTVVTKTKLPPSGDKHDYMSVGPYWWPDSTKPDGLPYIRRDGETNPERHGIKDADDMKSLSRDVKILGLAFYFTGEEKYARRASVLLRAWFLDAKTKMNPHLKYGQAIPGITEGRGIGIIDSKCLVDVVDGVQLIKESVSWKTQDHQALQQWFSAYLTWLQESPIGEDEEDEHNNHGVYYDVQTAAYALFTGNKTLAKQILQDKTLARIESQIADDGSQPFELARTKSLGYCFMNLKGFFALARIGELAGVDLWNYQSPKNKSIKKAFLWMLPYATGEKAWTHQQIATFDWSNFLPLVKIAAVHYPDLDVQGLAVKLYKNDGSQYLSDLGNTTLY